MNGLKIPLEIILAVSIQAIGLVWYVSKIDSKVEILYSQYQDSSQKAVIENQVRIEMELQQVIKAVVGMGQQVMINKEALEIIIGQTDLVVKQNKALKKQLNALKKQFDDSKKKKQTQKKLG